MLFRTPELRAVDVEVLTSLEAYRDRLRYFLGVPRRWRGQLRRNLRARAMRGSNSIEGYDVSLDDAMAILERDDEALDADRRTVLEVAGYRNAMTYVQQLADDPDFRLDESLIRSLHFMMLGHDLDKSPGAYRQSSIFVHDEDRGEVVYEGPDSRMVPGLMQELTDVLSDTVDQEQHPVFVTAAMAHLNLVMIHPFRDGNGRMARCLQTLMLSRHQVLGADFASVEEWLGRNTQGYYDVLARTGGGRWNPDKDTSGWIQFNLTAHHMQAQTVWHRVQESDELWTRLETLIAERGLPGRTVEGLFTAAQGLRLRRTTYQDETGLEQGAANRDLKTLLAAGLLEQRGQTRGRYYLGTVELRDLYREVRMAHRSQIVDPYEALKPIPPVLDTEPEGATLF